MPMFVPWQLRHVLYRLNPKFRISERTGSQKSLGVSNLTRQIFVHQNHLGKCIYVYSETNANGLADDMPHDPRAKPKICMLCAPWS